MRKLDLIIKCERERKQEPIPIQEDIAITIMQLSETSETDSSACLV